MRVLGQGGEEGRKEIQGLGAEAFAPPLKGCCERKQMVLIAVRLRPSNGSQPVSVRPSRPQRLAASSLWPQGGPGQVRLSHDTSLGRTCVQGVGAGSPYVTALVNEALLGQAHACSPSGGLSEQEPGLVPPDEGHVSGEQRRGGGAE